MHRHSVSSACTSNKNLRDLLSSTKSRQPALQTSNVIYQIPCKDCSATYCGQTSRPLHKRISEHERYTRPAYSHATNLQQSSALAQHAHASGHQIDFLSAVILAKLQHQQQLDLVEHAAITVLEPSLNCNQWHPILQSISEQFHHISITWSISPFTLVTPCLFSSLSLHLTCIYHCTYVSYHLISTHHSPCHISYFQYLSVCFIFISLADDDCNTAIESLQTDCLLRVFHSCYFHYSGYALRTQITRGTSSYVFSSGMDVVFHSWYHTLYLWVPQTFRYTCNYNTIYSRLQCNV